MGSKVIKGGGSGAAPSGVRRPAAEPLPESGVLHKRVLDARGEAEAIIAKAKDEARSIREEAKGVLEGAVASRDEAVRRGYAEGESKGLAQATEKLILLDELKRRFYDGAEEEVVRLVIAIAEKVMGTVAAAGPELIRSVVRQALEKALGDRITVRLCPDDLRALMAGDHEFGDIIDRTRRLSFREDEAISKGGCVVETEVGTIDARMETQLAAIRKALTAA